MRQASSLREETTALLRLRQRLTDALELAEMGDESLQDEMEAETEWLEAEVSRRETQSLLSGEYDRSNALLAIHAGAGGTDSQDWAAMLLRMYLRWAEQEFFSSDILDSSPGEEAGIKSATLAIDGDYAYGYLQSERGVHRLVRLSPFELGAPSPHFLCPGRSVAADRPA